MIALRLFIPLLLISLLTQAAQNAASSELYAAGAERLNPTPAVSADQNPDRKVEEEKSPALLQQGLVLMLDCGICLDEKLSTDCATLSCHHSYCRECLGSLVDQALREKTTAQLKCPAPGCAQSIAQNDIRTIINNDVAKIGILSEITAREWLLMQPNARQCPTPNCPYAFLNDDANRQSIKCPSCKKGYCPNCLIGHLNNQTCQQAQAQRSSDRNSAAWIVQNTKPCPRCNARIEKNGGCMFVSCQQCHYGFCWNCNGTHHVSVCNQPAAPQVNVIQSQRNITAPAAASSVPAAPVQSQGAIPAAAAVPAPVRVGGRVQLNPASVVARPAALAVVAAQVVGEQANRQYGVNNINFGLGSLNHNPYPNSAAASAASIAAGRARVRNELEERKENRLINRMHARITSWAPAVRSSANLAHLFKHEPPLPVYVRIAFDPAATPEEIDNFWQYYGLLSAPVERNFQPMRHRQFRDEFVITVPRSRPQDDLQAFLDRVGAAIQ